MYPHLYDYKFRNVFFVESPIRVRFSVLVMNTGWNEKLIQYINNTYTLKV